MQVRRVSFAVLVLAAISFAGCATDNPVSPAQIDATAPSAPTNLVASERSGDLLLTWDASADADVIGYDVYRYAPDPARENAYVKINSGLVTDNEYVVADAPSLAWYRVKAVDASSNASPASGALSAAAPGEGGSNDGVEIVEPGVQRVSRP